jgi:pimeloyl-ACP methyl ester carboxylesterase
MLAAALMLGQTTTDVSPGVHLSYSDTGGNGVPIVLMHAATGSIRSWDHQTAAFVKAGYRVIAFDRRGWGGTTVDQNVAAGTAADDLIALLDSRHVDRVHLVGTAAGGFVTLDAALSYPQRLRSIVVANSIGGVQDPEFVELGNRLRPPEFTAMPPALRELSPSYRAGDRNGMERWIALEKVSRRVPASAAQPLKNSITFSALESLRVPTLLLTGDADMFAPPPVLKMFAMHIRGAAMVVVPEAGHSTYWEQPDVFNQAVLSFIKKH